MTLQQEDKNTLVTVRFRRAKDTMAEVKGSMQLGYWRMAANRLYYVCYYAASVYFFMRLYQENANNADLRK